MGCPAAASQSFGSSHAWRGVHGRWATAHLLHLDALQAEAPRACLLPPALQLVGVLSKKDLNKGGALVKAREELQGICWHWFVELWLYLVIVRQLAVSILAGWLQ